MYFYWGGEKFYINICTTYRHFQLQSKTLHHLMLFDGRLIFYDLFVFDHAHEYLSRFESSLDLLQLESFPDCIKKIILYFLIRSMNFYIP